MIGHDDDGNLAGWHRDPSGRHELRFWGGDAWTEHVIDEGIPGLDVPTRSGRAPEGTTSTAPPPPVPDADADADRLTERETETVVNAEVVETPAAELPAAETPAAEPPAEVESPAETVEVETVDLPVAETDDIETEPPAETVDLPAAETDDIETEPSAETDDIEAEPAAAETDDVETVDLPAAEADDVETEPAAAETDDSETESPAETVDLPAAEADDIESESAAAITDDPALVTTASVLTPSSEREAGAGPNPVATPPTPPPTRPVGPGSSRPGGRSPRPRRRATPPIPPVVADAPTGSPRPSRPEGPAVPDAPIAAESTAVEPEAVGAASPIAPEGDDSAVAAASTVEPESTPEPTLETQSTPVTEPEEQAGPASPIGPARSGTPPILLVADSPTVASPAGNTAGSNTSAIADPHRAPVSARVEGAGGPRVAGVSPVPVKRYRPGSPPASPLAGPRALPASTGPVGTVVTPWYGKVSSWLAIVAIAATVALVVVLIAVNSDDGSSKRIVGRPPAAAPQGHKVIDGEGFGIAAPSSWIVATDPGNTFPQLRRTNWGTPLAATDSASGQALIVVPLDHLAHSPQVDPELFWSDQIKGAGTTRSIAAGPPLSVHGFRANDVTATDPSGKPLVAASIDTGDRTFLVAVTGGTPEAAQTEFDRLIQTFDAR